MEAARNLRIHCKAVSFYINVCRREGLGRRISHEEKLVFGFVLFVFRVHMLDTFLYVKYIIF